MSDIKLHRNKKGKLVPCNANFRACRYGGIDKHQFVTKTEFKTVNEVFEKLENKTNVEEQEETNGVYSVFITPENLEKAINSINKANRKLERQGIEDRFTYELEDVERINPETGYTHSFKKMTINKPVISENGWTFVGRIDEISDDNGNSAYIANSVNGEDINTNYNVNSLVCEHCGRARSRHKTYILRNDQGQYKQIGSSCVEGFLGVRPRGLWALGENPVDNDDYDPDRNGGFSRTNQLCDTKDVVAIALAVSNGGQGYVSSNNAQDGRTPTKVSVMNYIFGTDRNREPVDFESYRAQAKEMITNTSFEGEQDYQRNMRTLLAQERITPRHIGYVVSLIPAYHRQHRIAQERAARPPKAIGFIGDKDQKLVNVDAVVENISQFESDYGYHRQTVTMYIMRTPDNKVIKWSTTSNDTELNKVKRGSNVTLKRLTVKDFGNYNEEDQTIVKNVKLGVNDPVEHVEE
jgi:hypothetical protein